MSKFFPVTYLYNYFDTQKPETNEQVISADEECCDYEVIQAEKPRSFLVSFFIEFFKDFFKKSGQKSIRLNDPEISPVAEKTVFNPEKYLYLDHINFIRTMYIKLYGREASDAEISLLSGYFHKVGSNELLLYVIYKSAEFNNRFEIKNIDRYRYSYYKCRIKGKISRIPVLGSYLRLRIMERVMFDTRNYLSGINTRLTNEIISTSHYIDTLYERVNDHVNDTKRELKSIHDNTIRNVTRLHNDFSKRIVKVRSRTDNIYGAFEPYLDTITTKVPETMISNGMLDADSYLEKAKKDLSDEEKSFIDSCSFDDKLYFYMAKLFRGSEEMMVSVIFDNYLDFVTGAIGKSGNNTVIDLGCGKGDWMRYLRGHGITTKGVDINEASAHFSIIDGFEVIIDDVISYLDTLPENSAGVITMLAVSEHLTHDKLQAIIKSAVRVIAPGGIFIMDAPNPFCYFHIGSFYIDPSHTTWVSPEPMKLIMEMAGFAEVNFLYYAPYEFLNKSPNNICNYQGVGIIATKGKMK